MLFGMLSYMKSYLLFKKIIAEIRVIVALLLYAYYFIVEIRHYLYVFLLAWKEKKVPDHEHLRNPWDIAARG